MGMIIPTSVVNSDGVKLFNSGTSSVCGTKLDNGATIELRLIVYNQESVDVSDQKKLIRLCLEQMIEDMC